MPDLPRQRTIGGHPPREWIALPGLGRGDGHDGRARPDVPVAHSARRTGKVTRIWPSLSTGKLLKRSWYT
jgi:hypothetical protein